MSMDAKQAFNSSHYTVILKVLNKLNRNRDELPAANSILQHERLNAFPLRLGIRQRYYTYYY